VKKGMALSSYSKEDKQTHVELWSESGLSKQEYSIEIKYKTFLNWVYRFGTKPSPSKVSAESFIAIEVDSLPKNSRDKYSSIIEILHPNGKGSTVSLVI